MMVVNTIDHQMYRLFNASISSDIPLPGIPLSSEGKANLHIVRGNGAVDEAGFDWFHVWRERGTDGGIILSCARQLNAGKASKHLLRFASLADFLISDTTVICYPAPDCREDTLNHLLLDQVIPRLWAHLGHLVLHASAVQFANGCVAAFLGDSGWGKSTLVAAVQAQGGRLISDDSISLKVCNGEVHLVPSYVGLRLNPDSIETLNLLERNWKEVSHYSDKKRLVAGEACSPILLNTLYIMKKPGSASVPSTNRLAGADLITTLLKNSFLLDVNDRACAARQIREVGEVLSAIPNVNGLDYPRDYHRLTVVCDFLSAKALP